MRQPVIDDYVRLVKDIPELGLNRNEIGVVRSTWFAPSIAYEVEFHPRGQEHQTRALLLAEQGEYIRLFVDEGEPMVALLRHAYAHKIAPEYVLTLLSAAGSQAKTSHPGELVEPLTQRELAVLRLLGRGLSNTEIARELIITVGTVKRHVNSIYGKLGVQSRTQAVARAQTLHLL